MEQELRPILAITMGDPAGIGPEVIAKSWANPRIHASARLFVVADPGVMRRAVELVGAPLEIAEIDGAEGLGAHDARPDSMTVLPAGEGAAEGTIGEVSPLGGVGPLGGEAAYRCVRLATELALRGLIDGLVTAPLSKAALQAAGHDYPGHTELLAEMCGVTDFAMMLYLPPGELVRGPAGLGVVHVTLHQALRTVFEDLTGDSILSKCRLADRIMRRLGAAAPRIGVAALNPHGGEGGLFGNEETRIIAPAVSRACEEGIDASGPHPTDTLMGRARDGEFDAVVAMYHDQGHIALKLLGMHSAVNVTVGLPIVRTSVAHGTAFDKAWRGIANAEGMVAAITTAAKLARTRGDLAKC